MTLDQHTAPSLIFQLQICEIYIQKYFRHVYQILQCNMLTSITGVSCLIYNIHLVKHFMPCDTFRNDVTISLYLCKIILQNIKKYSCKILEVIVIAIVAQWLTISLVQPTAISEYNNYDIMQNSYQRLQSYVMLVKYSVSHIPCRYTYKNLVSMIMI